MATILKQEKVTDIFSILLIVMEILKKKQEFSIASINLFEIIPRKNYAKLTIFRRDPLLQE